MKKIQVRCVRGFGAIRQLHNIEVLVPLSGFGYSKRLYCCDNCGELFVLDLGNPELRESKEFLVYPDDKCPSCNISLDGHLALYPENVYLSNKIQSMDTSTITFDRESSLIEEFWEIIPNSPTR